MKSLVLVMLFVFGSFAPTPAHSQTGSSDYESQESPTKKKKKKKKKLRKKRSKKQSDEIGERLPPTPGEDEASETNFDEPSTAASSGGDPLFPDWSVEPFDWFASPVIGFQLNTLDNDSGTVRTTTLEGGLMAGLEGISVMPGNPGLTWGVGAGAAWGYATSVLSDSGDDRKSSLHYQRKWGGISATYYYKFFRYKLGLSKGRLNFSEFPDDLVQSFKVNNDFGFLIKNWISAHYTLNYLKAYKDKFDSPFLLETDNWVHTRFFTDVMDFVFDVGPGFTQTTAYDIEGESEIAKGTTNYFLIKTQMTLFWKVVGVGLGKYAYESSEKFLGTYATTRLPEDQLNEPSTLSIPEDSFQGSFFLGIKDIMFGVGAGWRYNIRVLNASGKNDTERETTKDQGFGLYYEVRF
jgi:hypothetical protein